MRRRLRSFALAAAILALVAACSSGGPDVERSDDATTTVAPATSGEVDAGSEAADPAALADVLRIGLVGVQSLDPAAVTPADVSSVLLADLLHDTLTTLDDEGVAQPGLATFTVDETGTTWRFQLTGDAMFADGSPITADDVAASLERVRGQGGSSLAAIQLDDVASITPVDATTVDIALTRPSAVLGELLSSPAFGIVDVDRPPGPVGTVPNLSGDFALDISSENRVLLQRRRGDGPATVDVRLFGDDATAYGAFVAGQLDWSPVPLDRLGEAFAQVGQRGLVPFHASVLLGVNTRLSPLDRPELRRAIALAIDRTTLTDAVFGPTAVPLDGLVPAGVPGEPGECVAPCGPDIDQAMALAGQAFPEGQQVPLRLLTDDSATHAALAGVLDDQLSAAGIEIEADALDASTYEQLLASGQQQLFLYSSLGVARTPAIHLLPWASTSPDNITGYTNELVDAAIDLARAEPDSTVRRARWREIEAAVLGDVPVVPLSQLRVVAAVAPRVAGLVVHADGSLDLGDVTLDGPESAAGDDDADGPSDGGSGG